MGCVNFVKFLKYKLGRKRISDRVAAVDIIADDDYDDTKGGSNYYFPKKYSWEDIRKLTMDFSVIIGYGGYGTVYLARFSKGLSAAVKVQCCSSERLSRAFRQELEVLRSLNHPNIVKLLGHCDDREEEGVLLLEYAPNGNLHDRLHGSNTAALPWRARVSIAYQLARAVDYLHGSSPHIVHGDIKPSNVLFLNDDDYLNCKLCDFGSARVGFSSAVTPRSNNRIVMVGSHGYVDPHYIRTGLASKKNDVYSLGVVILELTTGLEAFDRLTGERLANRVGLVLEGVESNRAMGIVDPRLEGEFNFEEIRVMAMIARDCLCDVPNLRPCATDILATLRREIYSLPFVDSENSKRI